MGSGAGIGAGGGGEGVVSGHLVTVRWMVVVTCYVVIGWPVGEAWARSVRHHLIRAWRGVVGMVVTPLEGALMMGPKHVAAAYRYEAYEREESQDRGTVRGKLFGIWRAPGAELKGIVDGVVSAVRHGGEATKELASVIWSD